MRVSDVVRSITSRSVTILKRSTGKEISLEGERWVELDLLIDPAGLPGKKSFGT